MNMLDTFAKISLIVYVWGGKRREQTKPNTSWELYSRHYVIQTHEAVQFFPTFALPGLSVWKFFP